MSSRSLAPSLAVSLALLMASSAPASAQDTPRGAADPGYEALITSAIDEFAVGHWAEARALFARAHAVSPTARTLRGIGMAAFEMRDYPAAVRALEDALASTARPLTDEQRAQVGALAARARLLVGRFVVPAAPTDARLFVDGERAQPGDTWPAEPGEILLAVGEHTVAIRTEAGSDVSARVTVAGSEDRTLELDLRALAPAPAAEARVDAAPPAAAPDDARHAPPAADPAPYVVLGAGAGVAVIGAVLLGVGLAEVASIEHAAVHTPWESLAGAYERTPALTGAGWTCLAVGVAAATLGLVWGVTSSGGADARAGSSVQLRVGLAGIALEGTF